MKLTILNIGLVTKLINEKGLKKSFIIKKLELSHTAGMLLLNRGQLPIERERCKAVICTLSSLLGVPPEKLVVTLVEQKNAA